MIQFSVKRFAFFLVLLFCGVKIFSQPIAGENETSPWKLKNLAKSYEKSGDYNQAIFYYKIFFERNNTHHKTAKKIADLSAGLRHYRDAAHYFGILKKLKRKKYPEAAYYEGYYLKMSGRCDTAVLVLEEFASRKAVNEKAKAFKHLALYEIEGCKLGDSLRHVKHKIAIQHLDSSINNPNVEFSPILLADSLLLYGSMILPVTNDTTGRTGIKKFYTAERKNGKWKGGIELEGDINDKSISVGNGCVSPDMMRFYFSRCQPDESGKVICELFMIKSQDGKWKLPKKLNSQINMLGYTSTQPSVGTDTKRNREILYFVSDRPGGKGGSDIWFSVYDKDKRSFSDPVNAGNKLNTAGDETTPFYHNATRTMYYSTNGLPSVGGFDIFKTGGEKKSWSQPENIGFPLNSSSDDLYFIMNQTGEEGFFVSNRAGGVGGTYETCCDDIYYFRNLEYVKMIVRGKLELNNDAAISDMLNIQNDSLNTTGSIVSLYVEGENGEYFLVSEWFTGTESEYSLPLLPGKKYKLVATKPGFFTSTREFNTLQSSFDEAFDMNLSMKPIPKRPIRLANIYFEYDKWDLTSDSKNTLDTTLVQLMNENEDLKIELTAHTDSRGDDEYNMNLSQKRAQSVVDYVIAKGIPNFRLVALGKGETEPIAPNSLPDGSDNPDGRKVNRRIEFRILQ